MNLFMKANADVCRENVFVLNINIQDRWCLNKTFTRNLNSQSSIRDSAPTYGDGIGFLVSLLDICQQSQVWIDSFPSFSVVEERGRIEAGQTAAAAVAFWG